ncbi:hypothetical protein CPAV1605_957 [seawater metagenome]|uniref:Glycosyl hydrolases family 18 n=1 Tax=seawater metagenome TaxID=1561972 RepID=A0A5E8CM11_9ZZZZ
MICNKLKFLITAIVFYIYFQWYKDSNNEYKNIYGLALFLTAFWWFRENSIENMDNSSGCDCGNYDPMPLQQPFDSLSCKGTGEKNLPDLIEGFNQHTWDLGTQNGPEDSNVGITYTDHSIPDSSSNILKPQTNVDINLISFGGVDDIYWDKTSLEKLKNQIKKIKDLGYDGISLDVQKGNALVDDFNTTFQAIRNAGLIVKVTITNFAPYGFKNKKELMENWIDNTNIDILSPQLYITGIETENVWKGYDDEYSEISLLELRNIRCNPRLCPTILNRDLYANVKEKLPNATGYFIHKNPPFKKDSPYAYRCGYSWQDAYKNCKIRKECSGGQDGECPGYQYCFDKVPKCNSVYGI